MNPARRDAVADKLRDKVRRMELLLLACYYAINGDTLLKQDIADMVLLGKISTRNDRKRMVS